MHLVDTHAHLASPAFADEAELNAVIQRAADAGVSQIISIGSELEDSRRNIEIAAAHPGVHATVGVHPTSVHEVTREDWVDDLRGLTRQPKVVAIGEIGMDFFHPPQDGSPEDAWRARQELFFRAQLDLAVELSMPVVIHQRESAEAIERILSDYTGRVTAVFHCFNGTPDMARTILDQGHYLSFTGIVTFPKATDVQESARFVPADRLMVETDSPYLAPVPHRGKRCEPAYTRLTAERIAELRGLPIETLAEITSDNASRFFGIPRFGP